MTENESFDYFSTGVTYARQPLEQFTTEGMKLLFSLLDGEEIPPDEMTVVLSPEIVDTSSKIGNNL